MRSFIHNSVCTSCFIRASLALHQSDILLQHVCLIWTGYATSSVFLCFFDFNFLPGLSSLPDTFHYQLEPSCSVCPTRLFPLNCILVLSTFLDGQTFVVVSPLTLFKYLNIQFLKLYLSGFLSLLLKNFLSIAWIQWNVHMNEGQCHIFLCYFSDTVRIVFVNVCLTRVMDNIYI